MTRPAADPLRAIDPDAFARAVERAAITCAREMARDAGLSIPQVEAASPARDAARDLCAYAQRGYHDDLERAAIDVAQDATETWLAIAEALGVAMPDDASLALAAARARLAVDGGHAVTLEGLGALAGVSLRTVRADLASGRLVATESSRGREREVTAMQARRWLAARGVPGYVAS